MGTETRELSLGQIHCWLRGHKVDRHRVWNDGFDHRTTCRRCGKPMIKDLEKWRPFASETDTDRRRKPHPHYNETGI